jgi:hypothetical protein
MFDPNSDQNPVLHWKVIAQSHSTIYKSTSIKLTSPSLSSPFPLLASAFSTLTRSDRHPEPIAVGVLAAVAAAAIAATENLMTTRMVNLGSRTWTSRATREMPLICILMQREKWESFGSGGCVEIISHVWDMCILGGFS